MTASLQNQSNPSKHDQPPYLELIGEVVVKLIMIILMSFNPTSIFTLRYILINDNAIAIHGLISAEIQSSG